MINPSDIETMERRGFLHKSLVFPMVIGSTGCNRYKLTGTAQENPTMTPKPLTPFDATEPENFTKSDRQKLEFKVHELVNIERRMEDFESLGFDRDLSYIARTKSRDMAMNNYFGHKEPDGDWHTDRLDEYGYDWEDTAENLIKRSAGPETHISDIAERAVHGWMSSQPHRGQILNSNYSLEGIGIFVTTQYTNYITQLLVD